jgi:aryl-alcohol dehydrogenase-like predicted oxidoreductase
MAQGLRLGVVGWSPLGGGLLSGKYRRGEQGRATNVTLSKQQVARLDAASAVALGFPHDLLAADAQRSRLAGGIPDQVETSPTPVA